MVAGYSIILFLNKTFEILHGSRTEPQNTIDFEPFVRYNLVQRFFEKKRRFYVI